MQPMTAATIEDVTTLKFPLYASPKLDGIRAVVHNKTLLSRNFKPIPNGYIQRHLPLSRMEGWDGELIVGKATDKNVFNTTTRGVMKAIGEPEFVFYVFDTTSIALPYKDRFNGVAVNIRSLNHKNIKIVPQVKIDDIYKLYTYEEKMLAKGYEGVMLRSIDGLYKHGRSTLKEGYLMKLKKFSDSEAVIIGFKERMHNDNEKKVDELGRSKRSSHKANKHTTDTLGALCVRDIHNNMEFDVGTGFDDSLRSEIWTNREIYLNKIIKYKYFEIGTLNKPRFPVFIGLRKD